MYLMEVNDKLPWVPPPRNHNGIVGPLQFSDKKSLYILTVFLDILSTECPQHQQERYGDALARCLDPSNVHPSLIIFHISEFIIKETIRVLPFVANFYQPRKKSFLPVARRVRDPHRLISSWACQLSLFNSIPASGI